MDLVGLDVCHHIGDVIYAHSRSPMHAPSPLLERMVTAGLLGRKSGEGFYTYAKPGSGQVVAHLHAWQAMTIDWCRTGDAGGEPQVPGPGRTWPRSPRRWRSPTCSCRS